MSEKELQSLMQRARRSLRSARNLLDDGDHDFAMSRAYYAMFYAATAALLSLEVKRSKHSGVIAAFGPALGQNREVYRRAPESFTGRFYGSERGRLCGRISRPRRGGAPPRGSRQFRPGGRGFSQRSRSASVIIKTVETPLEEARLAVGR